MRLSDLKRIVAEIEAETVAYNPDPDITFWLPRRPELVEPGPNDSVSFIETKINEAAPMCENRVLGTAIRVVQVNGDFTIPLMTVPFYR